MDDFTKDAHESYGVIQLSRIDRNAATHLFGSSIPHSNGIRLCIKNALRLMAVIAIYVD